MAKHGGMGCELTFRFEAFVCRFRADIEQLCDVKRCKRLCWNYSQTLLKLSDKTTLAWVPLWAKAHGIRTVLFSHERITDVVHERFPNWLPISRIILPIIQKMKVQVDAVVCASKYSADEFSDVADKLWVIPLGVDHDVFYPRDKEFEPTEVFDLEEDGAVVTVQMRTKVENRTLSKPSFVMQMH